MKAIAFTSGEYTAFLFLICSRKIKTTQISACIDLPATHADVFRAGRNGLEYGLIGINIGMYLIYISDFDRLSDLKCSFVGFLHPHDHAE